MAITNQPFDLEAGAAAGNKLLQLLCLVTSAKCMGTVDASERLVHLMSEAIMCNHIPSVMPTSCQPHANLMQSHAHLTQAQLTCPISCNHMQSHLPNRHSLGAIGWHEARRPLVLQHLGEIATSAKDRRACPAPPVVPRICERSRRVLSQPDEGCNHNLMRDAIKTLPT